MADKPFLNDTVSINIPLESLDEEASKGDELLPPPYQYPQINFRSGWKDRGFAIAFWIHMVAVIVVGLVLGIPILIPYVKDNIFNRQERTQFDSNTRLFVYSLGSAAVTSGFVSFVIFFLLQQCEGRIIICSLIMIALMQILLCLFLIFMVHWVAIIGPFIILLLTLYFIYSIRKRIPFAEAHLRVSFAVLRSHPSLIFVSIVMFVVELLWLAFWCLMVLGVLHASNRPILNRNINTSTTTANSTTAFAISDAKPTRIYKNPYIINNTTYRSNTVESRRYNTTTNSPSVAQYLYHNTVTYVIIFVLLLSWHWGAITLANVVHFIAACTVGQWWFTADTGQQYTMRTSIKRAFTTNFGTICFGSLLEAIIKAARSAAESKGRKTLFAYCAMCILYILEKLIGYINEWAFIYAALTGQSFIEASKSFIELFRNRGWTMVINDSIIGNCLAIMNIVVGFVSAAVSGLIVYILIGSSAYQITSTIMNIAIISFIIGVSLSTIMTTILSSCVRTIFVCFALNPAALGATHPDHLQSLTNVWHQFYPNEFATSGYGNYFPQPVTMDTV